MNKEDDPDLNDFKLRVKHELNSLEGESNF